MKHWAYAVLAIGILTLSIGAAHAASDDSPPAILNTIQNFEISTGDTAKLYLHTKFTDDGTMTYTADAADSTIVSIQTHKSRVAMTGIVEGTTQVTACASDGTNDPTCQTFRVSIQPSATPIKTSNTIQNFEISTGDTAKLYLHTKFSGQGTLEYTADAADSTIVSIQTDGSRVAMTGLKAGTTQVTACASNGAGESLCQKYRVTITAGLIIVPPSDVTAEATGVLTVVDIGTANHDSIRITNDAPDSFPLGDTMVTWSADGHESATQTVTIRDTTPPEFDRLRDIKIGVSPELPLLFYNIPDASDLADDSVDVSCTPARETAATFGTVNVVCTATDDSGNSSTGSFDVTIVPFDDDLTPDTVQHDLNAPIITAPDDITAEATGNLTTVDIGTAVAKDADGDFPTVTSNAPDSYPLGDTIVTWTATNSDGYVARVHQRITIQDTIPPVFAFAHLPLVTFERSIQEVIPPPVATDIFGIDNITCAYPASNIYHLGDNDITCTAIDANGLKTEETFTVNVIQNHTKVKLVPDDTFRSFGFGRYMEKVDDTLIVSGEYRMTRGHDPAIYIFKMGESVEEWSQTQRIDHIEGDIDNQFGRAISFDGRTIVTISKGLSQNVTQNNGTIHTYEMNDAEKWEQTHMIQLDHLINHTGNLRSIAIDEGTIVVGTYGTTHDGHSGIVDVYERNNDGSWSNTWTQNSYITDEPYGQFGKSVDIDGDTIVIGSPYANGAAFRSGVAHILEKNSTGHWLLDAAPSPDDLRPNAGFGDDVAVDGNKVIVGAKYQRGSEKGIYGAAYVFEKKSDTWLQTEKLVPESPQYRFFGDDVNIHDGTISVNAHNPSSQGWKSAVYLYEQEGELWNKYATIKPGYQIFSLPDSLGSDQDVLLVGNINDRTGPQRSGSAYLYFGNLTAYDAP